MQLIKANTAHLLTVKTWFNSHQAIYTWGGPNLTYPMSDDEFLRYVQAAHFTSFGLLNNHSHLVAFGQYYMRLNRRHLGRLAVNPQHRGQGLSKVLINELLAQAANQHPDTDASLFVFKDNLVAYRCYQSLGFTEVPYPTPSLPGNMQNCVYMVLPALN